MAGGAIRRQILARDSWRAIRLPYDITPRHYRYVEDIADDAAEDGELHRALREKGAMMMRERHYARLLRAITLFTLREKRIYAMVTHIH